jgi:hypothetical protein
MNRRQFVRGCALGAGALGLLGTPAWLQAAGPKTKIRLLYSLHALKQPGPDWPNKGFDFGPVMERNYQALTRQCKDFEFVTSQATGPEQAQKILEADKGGDIDGYLVFQSNCWNRVVQTIATSGKPVLYADFQFGGSGGFLVYNAGFLRGQAPNVGFVASSRPHDLVEAVKCFAAVKKSGAPGQFAALTARVRQAGTPQPGKLACIPDPLTTLAPQECLARMKAAKILAIRDQNAGPGAPMMEIPLENVAFAELNKAWEAADKDAARQIADRWENTAVQVEGVSRETLEQSAAMYLGMKALLKNHGANAITVNCLGGFYGNHIHAYPCLGFYELNNEGLVGGCECDVRSAATMVAFGALTQGRPGYISDPVIDTAKRQIIYAHCVASNKVFGPKEAANPFAIMTHSEDRQGASVRSFLPLGYLTTTLEIAPDRKQILLHQAKAVDNDPDDRACRTKLGAEPVGDIEKLFTQWDQWGWHRVTFYGDLKQPAYGLADALGWKVIEEA